MKLALHEQNYNEALAKICISPYLVMIIGSSSLLVRELNTLVLSIMCPLSSVEQMILFENVVQCLINKCLDGFSFFMIT